MKTIFGKRMSLALTLSLFVFFVMVTTFIVTGALAFLLSQLGLINLSWVHPKDVSGNGANPIRFLMMLFGFCLLLGQALTIFVGKKTLKPIRRVVEATHKVARGDFDVKVDLKGISELEELSSSFNKMTDELASIETLKRDFVNNFSHEFKTPIVSIRGFAKLLKKGELTLEEQHEYLDIIISESDRLAELSTQILNLSNYETVEIVGQKVDFRLDEQIRKAMLLLESKWTEKSLGLQVDLETCWLYGNEDIALQIWLNLIDNAIKFSPVGGVLEVTLRSDGEVIFISIKDDGCGMDTQTQTHIFEKFYRADQSHHLPGNGIGLAIVDRLVTLMEGKITVESAPDKGSKFTVALTKTKNSHQ